MTPQPQSIGGDSPVSSATRLLLSSVFTGLPVVDQDNRPLGVLTQGDLLSRGGLPLRLGLLSGSSQDEMASILALLDRQRVRDIMTAPAVVIGDDQPLTTAVETMLAKGLKRLPVVEKTGKLVGMLSRLDIFKTVMREAPDWDAFRAQKIEVSNLRRVADIVRRDTHTVAPETTMDKVIAIIDDNDIQRVAVVDGTGKLLGIIADRDLLHYFKPDREGLYYLFSKMARPFRNDPPAQDIVGRLAQTPAGEVMSTEVITIVEGALIADAIRLMTEKTLKRLAVVDAAGRFLGMISRESLLRSGFALWNSFAGAKK